MIDAGDGGGDGVDASVVVAAEIMELSLFLLLYHAVMVYVLRLFNTLYI